MKLYIDSTIAAAHYLPNYPGACQNMHGHTWRIEVWLQGEVDPTTGMLVDFRFVKDIVNFCDHCVLNEVLPQEYLPPTAENLATYFLRMIPQATKVRVWESNHCYAEVDNVSSD